MSARVSYVWLRMVLAISWTLDKYFAKNQTKPTKDSETAKEVLLFAENLIFRGFFCSFCCLKKKITTRE